MKRIAKQTLSNRFKLTPVSKSTFKMQKEKIDK